MPSPFPGMDPYLEAPQHWPDFHSRFINCWCEAIADALPDPYVARIDERVTLVQEDDEEARQLLPDVAVSRWEDEREPNRSPAGGVATLEPVTIPVVYIEPTRQGYIEIYREPDRELVTTLELLSPSNKSRAGFGEYLGRRDAVMRQEVHLFELDLLLGGRRMPLSRPLPPGDYYALVTRTDRRPMCEVYSWSVRDRLPTLPIPLRAPDPDIHVDLAAVMNTTYERGRYAKSVRYEAPPETAMASPQREWIVKRGVG